MVIENVPEYKAEIIERELGKQWSIKHCVIDPRVLGVPACRTRLYAIAWKHAEVNWRNDIIMEDVIEVLTSRVVGNAGAFFWDDLPKTQLRPAQDFWLHWLIVFSWMNSMLLVYLPNKINELITRDVIKY